MENEYYDSCTHNEFVTIIPMTPEEYEGGGKNLQITYSFAQSPFGEVLIASTPKGICNLNFIHDRIKALINIRSAYPCASYKEEVAECHKDAMTYFDIVFDDPKPVTLHIKGTEFQHQVWSTLLKIPVGARTSYSNVAFVAGHPKAVRAVGTAMGKNPVAYIIPCHRVTKTSGRIGEYRWGIALKAQLITSEMPMDRYNDPN